MIPTSFITPDNQPHTTGEAQAASRPKILLVDDRPENLLALRRLLRSMEADLIEADSGPRALALTLRHQFALILLDVQMPDMNGFEVAELLHDNPETRAVPIIFITALSKEERYVAKGYASGAVDYLSKPLDPDMLLSKVKVFLELNRKTLELKQALAELAELHQQHRLLVECAGEGIVGFDRDGRITFANPMAHDILAPGGGPLQGRHLLELLGAGNDAATAWPRNELHRACQAGERLRMDDTILWKRDGSSFATQYTVAPYDPDQGAPGGVMILQDITARKQAEQALVRLAQFDALTGLANRRLFLQSLGEALSRARRHDRQFGIIFLDMDRFKEINDAFGHLAGDDLLKVFAQRLKDCVRKEDVVARFGGDEFAILAEDIRQPDDLAAMAQKVLTLTGRPTQLNGRTVTVGTSLGIALFPRNGRIADELLHAADSAMYRAKDQGRNGYCFA
jgi:diguanylate cyclase (GGDEF)-like protein/PAS domain S-box-containing protein